MAEEVHQKYDFIDPYDSFLDGSPYKAKPTDKPWFFEYVNQLKTTEVLFLFPFLLYLKHHSVFMLISLLNHSLAMGFYPIVLTERTPLKQLTQQLKSLTGLSFMGRGADLKLSKILNANCLLISNALYFLTLQCSDGLVYEAKIDMPVIRDEGRELVMFRPAKYFPRPRKDKNTNEEGDAEPEGLQVVGKKRKKKDTDEGGVEG
ncbi:hypothetical protein Ddye_026440 [Dipteronia dyeriana]|uniref:Uncharacterized protein n=1 Tax=Dipteronia dyeriana TaxID=168575 RepID=A0AAD9TM81_9ROSI|nr:hypothetical protein Ddye_026440 [Dipteronia dyeriana]